MFQLINYKNFQYLKKSNIMPYKPYDEFEFNFNLALLIFRIKTIIN